MFGWAWVGDGNGAYEQIDQFDYVGDGVGAYEPEVTTVVTSWRVRRLWIWVGAALTITGIAALVVIPGAPRQSVVNVPTDVRSTRMDIEAAASPGLQTNYECGPVGVDQWQRPQRDWCCQEFGKCFPEAVDPAMPPSATAVAMPLPLSDIDCNSGLRHWDSGWSDAKKEWCCHHHGQGCVPSAAPADPPMPPRRPSASPVYDCSEGAEEVWSVTKRGWCCIQIGRGCRAPEERRQLEVQPISGIARNGDGESPHGMLRRHIGHVPSELDCRADWATWRQSWSSSKKAWCCSHEGRGCQDVGARQLRRGRDDS